MSNRFTIVSLGEALIHYLPDTQHIGGAPLNVAAQAHQLAQKHDGNGVLVSRLGQDDAGKLITEHLKARQMETAYLQSDPDLPTGRMYTQIDTPGQRSHDIIKNVAWDVIQFDPDLEELAHRCDAVYFGTLAQRHPQSRQTMYRFLSEARRAVKLFDVNLHGELFDAGIFRRSCEQATLVKMNLAQLPQISIALGLDESSDPPLVSKTLFDRYDLTMVILTRGAQGTLLLTPDNEYLSEPADYLAGENADYVGAGDACCAAVLTGLCMRLTPEKLVVLANHAGAFAASQPGGTAEFPPDIVNLIG